MFAQVMSALLTCKKDIQKCFLSALQLNVCYETFVYFCPLTNINSVRLLIEDSFSRKMSKRMRDSLPYLQILAKCKPKVRKVLIEHGPSNLVLSICECCHNVLKGTVPLTKRQKQHLS